LEITQNDWIRVLEIYQTVEALRKSRNNRKKAGEDIYELLESSKKHREKVMKWLHKKSSSSELDEQKRKKLVQALDSLELDELVMDKKHPEMVMGDQVRIRNKVMVKMGREDKKKEQVLKHFLHQNFNFDPNTITMEDVLQQLDRSSQIKTEKILIQRQPKAAMSKFKHTSQPIDPELYIGEAVLPLLLSLTRKQGSRLRPAPLRKYQIPRFSPQKPEQHYYVTHPLDSSHNTIKKKLLGELLAPHKMEDSVELLIPFTQIRVSGHEHGGKQYFLPSPEVWIEKEVVPAIMVNQAVREMEVPEFSLRHPPSSPTTSALLRRLFHHPEKTIRYLVFSSSS